METKIELRKEIRPNGEIWWCFYKDNVWLQSFINEKQALSYYENVKKEVQSGLITKTEIIKLEIINQ